MNVFLKIARIAKTVKITAIAITTVAAFQASADLCMGFGTAMSDGGDTILDVDAMTASSTNIKRFRYGAAEDYREPSIPSYA